MATKEEKLQKLEANLKMMQETLTKYGNLFNEDSEEQQQLNKMQTVIKKAEAKLAEMKKGEEKNAAPTTISEFSEDIGDGESIFTNVSAEAEEIPAKEESMKVKIAEVKKKIKEAMKIAKNSVDINKPKRPGRNEEHYKFYKKIVERFEKQWERIIKLENNKTDNFDQKLYDLNSIKILSDKIYNSFFKAHELYKKNKAERDKVQNWENILQGVRMALKKVAKGVLKKSLAKVVGDGIANLIVEKFELELNFLDKIIGDDLILQGKPVETILKSLHIDYINSIKKQLKSLTLEHKIDVAKDAVEQADKFYNKYHEKIKKIFSDTETKIRKKYFSIKKKII
ncbi:hypothetical protein OAK19_05690 [Aureispira]|nr:hypothetical protein [Aureispira sp.]